MGGYVLYYHRIYPKSPASDMPLPLFEWEMRYLKKRYQVLSLNELIDFINGNLPLNKPVVSITFDDGWFDNFVYAYPILKKYGMKATVFVSTEKIWRESIVRPTLDDCWNKNLIIEYLQKPQNNQRCFAEPLSDSLKQEFLTWDELRIMQKSGIFDIQSHGVEHRKVFSGDAIIDFSNGNPGLAVKFAASDIRPGVPIYPIRSSLSTKIFHPDSDLNDHLAMHIKEKGREVFNIDKKFRVELLAEVDKFKSANPLSRARWETEDEMRKRVTKDLIDSRDTIYAEIGTRPIHFCWPWGQYSNTGIELAREAGYIACYTTRAGSVSVGTDRYRIPRVSTRGGKITFMKRGLVYSNPSLSRIYQFLNGRC